MNRVILIGNADNEPSLEYTPSNMPVCRFILAVPKNFQKGCDDMDYFNVSVPNGAGVTAAGEIHKGDPVVAEGHLHSYTDKEGKLRSVFSCIRVFYNNVR